MVPGNFCIRLFIGVAILWQLMGLVYYNSHVIDSGSRELLLLQLKDDPPTRVQNDSKNDSIVAPIATRRGNKSSSSRKKSIFDNPSQKTRTDHSETFKIWNAPKNKKLNNTAKTTSTYNLRHGWKPAKALRPMNNKHNTTATTISATTKHQTTPKQALLTEELVSIRTDCFASNSDEWIEGTTNSNSDEGVTQEFLDELIEAPLTLRKLPSLFRHTICHENSPIRAFSKQDVRGGGDKVDFLASTEDWYHRFLYLALHWKFHKPALTEHRSRKRCAGRDVASGKELLKSFMKHHKIGKLDFECRDAKFVVIPVGSIGFGAFLNTQASLSILLALRTNRIPVFTSKSFFSWQKRKGDMDPWLLAPSNCDRKDMQCYFLPLSPCTITNKDLHDAPIFGSNRHEQKFLGKNVTIPPELESEKVVVLNSGLSHKTVDSPDMRQIASVVVGELLSEFKQQSRNEQEQPPFSDEERKAMDLAHQWITEKTKTDPVGLLRQVYVYMLRPIPRYKDVLNKHMAAIANQPIDPSKTIGMAIRGSDKCFSESTCLPFDRYMEIATDVALPTLPSNTISLFPAGPITAADTRPQLIMTTEDPNIFNDSLIYQRNDSFPFKFLVNSNDNMQGSGYPRAFSFGEGEKTIVSSLTALRFHFNAGKVYLNCCSNFHIVLKYLLHGQCGARRHGHDFVFDGVRDEDDSSIEHAQSKRPRPVAQCMGGQEMPRRYRICCNWSKSSACKDVLEDYRREHEQQSNALVEN